MLVEKGELYSVKNWPSNKLDQSNEPFTDFAPGTVFLLSIFVCIVKNLIISTIILQAILILILNLFLYYLFEELKIDYKIKIVGLFLFSFIPFTSKILYTFWSELPFIICILGSILYLIKIYNAKDSIKISYIILASVFLFLSSSIKYIGVFTLLFVFIVFYYKETYYNESKYKILGILVCSSVTPILIWFTRNKMLYGYTTFSHKVGQQMNYELFNNIYYKLYSIHPALFNILTIFAMISIVAILLYVVIFFKNKNKFEIQYAFYFLFLLNFFGIVFLSFVSKFNDLGIRLLAPSISVFILCFILILNNFNNKFFLNSTFYIVLIISMLFEYKEIKLIHQYPFTESSEKYLWENINKIEKLKSSTIYFTEFDNYKSQLYSNKSFRSINSNNISNLNDTNTFKKLKSFGTNPFFVLWNTSEMNKYLMPLVKSKTIEKINYEEYGTSIYIFK